MTSQTLTSATHLWSSAYNRSLSTHTMLDDHRRHQQRFSLAFFTINRLRPMPRLFSPNLLIDSPLVHESIEGVEKSVEVELFVLQLDRFPLHESIRNKPPWFMNRSRVKKSIVAGILSILGRRKGSHVNKGETFASVKVLNGNGSKKVMDVEKRETTGTRFPENFRSPIQQNLSKPMRSMGLS
ncbi:hypothetical protein LXL04_033834 [Taraxacum kok-saghyz]